MPSGRSPHASRHEKGPKRRCSDPFLVHRPRLASLSNTSGTSVVTPVLFVLDGGGVVPAVAASREVGRWGGKLGLGLAIAASPERRAAPGRELVDPCGPLVYTRIHHHSLSFCRGASLHGAPDSFSTGYISRYCRCPERVQGDQESATFCLIRGHFWRCFLQGSGRMTNA